MTWDLGRRLRETRLRLGMTQHEVASGIVSSAFLSMVESGRREPSPDVLTQLVERLGLDPDALRDTGGTAALIAIRTGIARAEVQIDSGDFATALLEIDAIDRLFSGLDEPDLRVAFHHKRGLALEGLSRVDSAIRELVAASEIAEQRGDSVVELAVGIDLVRCLRIRGDLSAALDRVVRMQAALTPELEQSASHGRLLAEEIVLYLQRGDAAMASLCAERAQAFLDARVDPSARSLLLWSASLAAEANDEPQLALTLASEAAALMRTGADGVLRGRLAASIAQLHTRTTPADLDAAAAALSSARVAFGSGINALDASALSAESARLEWLRGEYAESLASACEALQLLEHVSSPMHEANAHLMVARAHASLGDAAAAREAFLAARDALSPAEPTRSTAVAWRELGDVLLGVGMADEAVASYQLALAGAGLAASPAETSANAASSK